jgi:hypothetical protein
MIGGPAEPAYDAVFDLSIDLHYRGCSGGVGLSPRKPE